MTMKEDRIIQSNITRKALDGLCEQGYITEKEWAEISKYTYKIPEGECGWASIITPERSFSMAIEENPGFCDLEIDLYVDDLKYEGIYIKQNNGADFHIKDRFREVGEFFIDFL